LVISIPIQQQHTRVWIQRSNEALAGDRAVSLIVEEHRALDSSRLQRVGGMKAAHVQIMARRVEGLIGTVADPG
jgi:hypothetical protein